MSTFLRTSSLICDIPSHTQTSMRAGATLATLLHKSSNTRGSRRSLARESSVPISLSRRRVPMSARVEHPWCQCAGTDAENTAQIAAGSARIAGN